LLFTPLGGEVGGIGDGLDVHERKESFILDTGKGRKAMGAVQSGKHE
jgi:hypothetical protein